MSEFGVYVHIPFCRHRCDYCAFATWTDKDAVIVDYVEAVCRDIEQSRTRGLPVVDTVFFGGGTPTRIDARYIAQIVRALPLSDNPEVTVECNPDDVTPQMMEIFADAGVNRVSIGVQSMVPHVLNTLGRTHNPDNVGASIDAARRAGITSINCDVIYGSVGESLDDWRTTIEGVIALGVTHVSAYGLTVEPGTELSLDPSRHPDDDDQADKYLLADDVLTSAGFENYEISNWAIPGHSCRHNKVYWSQGNYQGFGCAAHSHLDGRRWWNVRTPERYIACIRSGDSVEASDEILDIETRVREGLELSLRTSDGVPVGVLDEDELVGLVERRGTRVVLTRQGRLLANEVSLRLRPR
ncbi:MAG: putative oxygen-independent coproporphyrinogen oxidase [Actinomycetota bacterium]|jgi:oxygen-independent coproporphyrinogen-3 oxidase